MLLYKCKNIHLKGQKATKMTYNYFCILTLSFVIPLRTAKAILKTFFQNKEVPIDEIPQKVKA